MLHGPFLLLAVLSASMPALARPAPPGTVVRLSPAERIDRCDLCLEGRVTAARAILEPGGRIDTEYTISVARTLWGEPQASRPIRLPGGVLPDGRGMAIPGLPSLALGDEVLLFLSGPDASGMRIPIGLAQGRLRVVTDRNGRKRLAPDAGGLAFAGPGRSLATGGETVPDYPALIAEIEAAAAARRARERVGAPKTPESGGRR